MSEEVNSQGQEEAKKGWFKNKFGRNKGDKSPLFEEEQDQEEEKHLSPTEEKDSRLFEGKNEQDRKESMDGKSLYTTLHDKDSLDQFMGYAKVMGGGKYDEYFTKLVEFKAAGGNPMEANLPSNEMAKEMVELHEKFQSLKKHMELAKEAMSDPEVLAVLSRNPNMAPIIQEFKDNPQKMGEIYENYLGNLLSSGNPDNIRELGKALENIQNIDKMLHQQKTAIKEIDSLKIHAFKGEAGEQRRNKLFQEFKDSFDGDAGDKVWEEIKGEYGRADRRAYKRGKGKIWKHFSEKGRNLVAEMDKLGEQMKESSISFEEATRKIEEGGEIFGEMSKFIDGHIDSLEWKNALQATRTDTTRAEMGGAYDFKAAGEAVKEINPDQNIDKCKKLFGITKKGINGLMELDNLLQTDPEKALDVIEKHLAGKEAKGTNGMGRVMAEVILRNINEGLGKDPIIAEKREKEKKENAEKENAEKAASDKEKINNFKQNHPDVISYLENQGIEADALDEKILSLAGNYEKFAEEFKALTEEGFSQKSIVRSIRAHEFPGFSDNEFAELSKVFMEVNGIEIPEEDDQSQRQGQDAGAGQNPANAQAQTTPEPTPSGPENSAQPEPVGAVMETDGGQATTIAPENQAHAQTGQQEQNQNPETPEETENRKKQELKEAWMNEIDLINSSEVQSEPERDRRRLTAETVIDSILLKYSSAEAENTPAALAATEIEDLRIDPANAAVLLDTLSKAFDNVEARKA